MVVLGRSVLENRVKLTAKKLKIQQVTRALLGDIVPPPMMPPSGVVSENVWVTLESGEILRAYFHSNGYCYDRARGQEGIFRWARNATIGGGATEVWRAERPWVVSWSNDAPTKAAPPGKAAPLGGRKKFRLLLQTIRPRLQVLPLPIPDPRVSPSKKAPRAPRAAKRG